MSDFFILSHASCPSLSQFHTLSLHDALPILGLPERLELFAQVCRAIQHAHSKSIIHRDLKPSNVLVMMQDGRAVPKVIDLDRKSTRLNSSHLGISYAVFCLKKKNNTMTHYRK